MTGVTRSHALGMSATVTTTLLFASGCAATGLGEDPEEVLQQRPTLEEAETQYLDLLAEASTATSETAPTVRNWTTPKQEGEAGCAEPFTDVDGTTSARYGTDGTGGISDEAWPQTYQRVTDVAAEHGFTETGIIKSEPGLRVVSFYDPDTEAELSLQTEVNTPLSVYGACHLEAAYHD